MQWSGGIIGEAMGHTVVNHGVEHVLAAPRVVFTSLVFEVKPVTFDCPGQHRLYSIPHA